MKDIEKYLENNNAIILIKPNEAKIIEYRYSFEQSYEAGDINIINSLEYSILSKAVFKAEDTLGKFYQYR